VYWNFPTQEKSVQKQVNLLHVVEEKKIIKLANLFAYASGQEPSSAATLEPSSRVAALSPSVGWRRETLSLPGDVVLGKGRGGVAL
jgi:hypothetical protein